MTQMRPAHGSAFTIVELLASTAVLSLIIVVLAALMSQSSAIWNRTTGKVEQFREARAAFEVMTTRLGQATLNTYWDYQYDVPGSASAVPKNYTRRSELRFTAGPSSLLLGTSTRERPTHGVFFQAPLGETIETDAVGGKRYAGFENLLCTWGYYLEFADDLAIRPAFIKAPAFPARYRYRLMEVRQPAEENRIYSYTSGSANTGYNGRKWFTDLVDNPTLGRQRVAAENVLALIITPRLAQADEAAVSGASGKDNSPLAPDYFYDSSPTTKKYSDGRLNPVHQLPPLLQVTLVAADETSIVRLNLNAKTVDPFGLIAKKRFLRSADYTKDLTQGGDAESLENTLIKRHINYRIFSTNIVIRGARWSRETTN